MYPFGTRHRFLSHTSVRVATWMAVTIRMVGGLTRATPENQQETVKQRDPQRPYASHLHPEMKRWSGPCGDVGRAAEMTAPCCSSEQLVTGSSEIPCRVSMNDLPLGRVISLANPANNGEPLARAERGIPWEVESLRLFDPVTTEAKAEMAFLPQGKSMNAIRRRPFGTGIDLPSYISGYVDGEGCFCVSLRPQARIRVGWEVRPSFSVSQNGDRAELIKLLPDLFGAGTIRPDRSDKTLKFEIRSLKYLNESVIPFFEAYPLLSSKRKDFELFRRICKLMQAETHRDPLGLVMIAELAQQMNAGMRKYTVETIKASFKGEGIVCAPGNGGTT